MTELDALTAARAGDTNALGRVLDGYRARLARMVELRLDPRLRQRVDAEDVVQETFVEVARRLDEYLANPKLAFFLWVRFLAVQRLLQLHRAHFEVGARTVEREIAVPSGAWLSSAAESVASAWCASNSTPSVHAVRDEARARVQAALAAMKPIDREVLVLRHFEHLSNAEVAQLLGLEESAASRRHLRALERLRAALDGWTHGDGPGEAPRG